MKHLATILCLFTLSHLHYFTLSAAVPVSWTVDVARVQPEVRDVVRGETVALEATLQSDGKPFATGPEPVCIFWQTNGMGSAWWSRPCVATASSPSGPTNVLSATFTPAMDPGASSVIGFLGSSGSIYRAAFHLRFRHGPGAVPNVLDVPPRVLDLAHTVVVNPPWPTDATIDASIRRVIDEDGITAPVSTNTVKGIISNTVDKAYVESLGISGGGSGGTNTNDVKAIVDAEVGGTNDVKEAVAAIPHLVSATNDLTSSVSGLASSKRSETNLVYKVHVNATPWTVTYDPDSFDYEYGVPAAVWGYNEFGDFGWFIRVPGYDSYILSTDEDGATYLECALYLGGAEYTIGMSRQLEHDEVDTLALVSQLPEANQLLTSKQRAELDVLPGEVDEAKSVANEANVWSASVYNFMTGGRTNCWFSGTNYVFGADAATRTRFAWEDGMDAATVPCSMALWEIRDGDRQLVWDQRDWTAWYWSFKAAQMTADIQGRIDALGNAVTNASNYAWAKRYASDGTPNPDASTTFIDTPSVTLSPGMKWETVATAAGAAYWTIVGNGAVIGGTGTNAVLRIMDFEGNDIMTVTKGKHRLAWLESGDITGNMLDEERWVCFDMLADAEPVGHFSTTLDSSDFVPQTDPDCPAQYIWENIGGGKWRVHFLLKPGIQANACFAKFQVEVEGQTVIRYNAGQEISGGLIYNGVKIAPDVSGSPAVGTVIQWKVVR